MLGPAALARAWLANPWLLWGAGPVLSSTLGFVLTAALLEAVLSTDWAQPRELVYTSSQHAPRRELLARTQQRIAFSRQLASCFKLLLGPPSVVGGAVLAALMRALLPSPATAWLPASVGAGAWQLLALAVVNDFGLYWGA
jgi:hypothetical protein